MSVETDEADIIYTMHVPYLNLYTKMSIPMYVVTT